MKRKKTFLVTWKMAEIVVYVESTFIRDEFKNYEKLKWNYNFFVNLHDRNGKERILMRYFMMIFNPRFVFDILDSRYFRIF